MEISGKVVNITPVQTVGTNGFKKCELWIETPGEYPQTLCVEFTKELAEKVQEISNGEDLKISVNIRGRVWENPTTKEKKCFNSIQGYKYESDF